jgi:hypothetical protein
MEEKLPRLEGWILVNWGSLAVAEGFVYGSPKFQDGEYIHTSWLRAYSLSEGKITTRNGVYLLGKPAKAPPADHEVIIKKEDK